MAPRTIKGGQVQSVKQLKRQLKKGGASFMTRVPADGALTVRFIEEPDRWVTFYEHYDAVRNFYPCSDDCPGCDEGDSPSQRYLANALDVDEGKVIPLMMPKQLANSVLKRYDKYGTLLDRDYELTRDGEGFDTNYDSIPEPPTKVNVKRYDPLDLWGLVEQQLPDEDDLEDDEDDEDEAPVRRRKRPSASKRRTTIVEDDDEDEDDYDDEDEEDDEPPVRRRTKPAAKKKAAPMRRKPAKKAEPKRTRTASKNAAPTRRKPPAKKAAPTRTMRRR